MSCNYPADAEQRWSMTSTAKEHSKDEGSATSLWVEANPESQFRLMLTFLFMRLQKVYTYNNPSETCYSIKLYILSDKYVS